MAIMLVRHTSISGMMPNLMASQLLEQSIPFLMMLMSTRLNHGSQAPFDLSVQRVAIMETEAFDSLSADFRAQPPLL